MKPINLLLSIITCLLAVRTTVSSRAQGRPAAQNASEQRPAAAMAQGLGPIANVLTEEQRSSLRKNMAAQRERTRNLETQLRDARRELLAATVSGTFDEQAIRPKAMAVARLEAQMAVTRARAVSQIQPPLSPEQKERIMSSLPAAEGRGVRALNGRRNSVRRGAASTTDRDENNLPPKQ